MDPYVLPSNAPALPEPHSTIPSRVLQERSGNRRHGYPDYSLLWKRSDSPTENLYPHNTLPNSSYFTANIASQIHSDRSEEQIDQETKWLWNLLQRCEKYIKYRDRQPQTAKEKKDAEKQPTWPDKLEYAFVRGLVRYLPMGRRKLMLDGQPRGRNELVSDSILKETGVKRDRKQVSSHIQVLKNILSGHPQLLAYMSTKDIGGKRRHASSHLSPLRSRHQPSSKYDFSSGDNTLWQGRGSFSSSRANIKARGGVEMKTPYAVTHFGIVIHDETKECVQRVTQLADHGRMDDINVTDTSSWYKQYPELSFHDTEELRERHVLVCDASIKIMTEQPRGSELSILYVIEGQHDLSVLEPLQCRTQFYDSGELADQSDKQGQAKKETQTSCDFASDSSRGIKFGSQFWVDRMRTLRRELLIARDHEEQSVRSKLELDVRRSLQYLTARQDIYTINPKTGEESCVLTILWRFHQTRTANEQGKMTWRVVNFATPPTHSQQPPWIKSEDLSATQGLGMMDHSPITTCSSYPPTSTYPSFSFDEFHHQFFAHPPPLDLDSLAQIAPEELNAFSNPTSATAPSMTTDYSQTHSLPSLTHLQDHTNSFSDANDIDFTGGHINLHLEPAINFGDFEGYGTHSQDHGLSHMSSIAGGLEQANVRSEANAFGDLNVDGSLLATCYPTKPWQHYNDLISRFERAAEHQTHDLLRPDQHNDHSQANANAVVYNEDLVAHGLLHGGEHLGQGGGLWKLQTSLATT
ncbi:hypothetical protein K491DRAFT_710317 [Lophiostoma macrostomum CBS 122681]|uniref:TEA domain-containing protein n=1 Tax=Lophiostoma macrostomum CBS 122681 TaxID=1314788 RepID=A0A6A6TPA4_9PLEO|nr:hypothetical protein K491DRAFT_710317 [Lophiostoma macrostomum CBS 122681]